LSGSRPGPPVRAARSQERAQLLVGATVAARYNPQLKNFRDKLVARSSSLSSPSAAS